MAALAVVASVGIALSGCGSSSTAESSDEKVTLTYVHRLPDGDGMTKVSETVARWNKENPNIQVKATKFDGKPGDLIKKLETDSKAGTAPDMAQIGYAEIPEVFSKGLLEDVTEEVKEYEGNFASGPMSLMKIDGKAYGIPQDTGPLLYYYNKAEFEKLGIEVPTTQDELIETAKKAAAQGKYILAYEPDEVGYMFSGLAGASTPWYTIDGSTWKVNTKTTGSDAVASVYQTLLDEKAVTTNPRWDPSFDASLKSGELIGTIGAAWEAPLLKDSAEGTGAGDWRVTQIGDWFENKGKTGPDGGSGVAVIKGTKHKAAVTKFLNWFNTQVTDLVSQGLIVAATTESPKTPESWASFYGDQDVMAEFTKANDNMGDFIYIPGFSAVSAAMAEAGGNAANGSGKISAIFDAAQTTSVDTLKNLGLTVAE